MPHARHAMVEQRRWISNGEFAETLSLGQALPGPNIVNMGLMLGYRFRGLRGALATIVGLMLAPMVIVLMLAGVYSQYAQVPLVQRVTAGVAFAAAGLILSTGIRMVLAQSRRAAVWALVGATVTAKVAFGWPLLLVLSAFTALGLICAWRDWL